VDRSELADSGVADELVTSTAADWAASLDEKRRPELVIEAVGHQVETLDDAVAACGPEGTVLYFGIPDEDVYPINMERVMRKNLTVVGGVTRDRRGALLAADRYLADHPNLPGLLITHRFGRTEIAMAFDTATRAEPGRLKVVLDLAGHGST
jgi:threonine dehydrogenase-like Zn-dependent dehydrogenase